MQQRRPMGVWAVLCMLAFSALTAQIQVPHTPDKEYSSLLNLNDHLVYIAVDTTVTLRDYFTFMDSTVAFLQRWGWSDMDEYVLVRYNHWLVDSLASTDYYLLKSWGVVVDDPQEWVILKPGDRLYLPDAASIDSLHTLFEQTWLDLNLPEFKLKVIVGDTVRYNFLVRVGRNESKYLAMAGRVVDLRTRTGEGEIVSINRNPEFINPVDNKKYILTNRDDGRVTKLPRIPFLEPQIGGIRFGQMIHPTTNPSSLGQAYSNGCIGVSEQAAWYLYYYAPKGTAIRIRYDLHMISPAGDTIRLPDIYSVAPLKSSSNHTFLTPQTPNVSHQCSTILTIIPPPFK